MKPFSERGGLVVLAVLLLVPVPGQARPVPLADLTQDLIRTRVAGYLALDTTRKKLAPLDPLVRLDPRQITYQAVGGQPRQLVWAYQPLAELNNVQRAVVDMNLEDVLVNVFGNYQGGLLTDQDAQAVLRATRLVPAGMAPAGERPPRDRDQNLPGPWERGGARESAPTTILVTQAVVCWYAAPGYWGEACCGMGYYPVPVTTYCQVPVQVAPSSGRTMPYSTRAPAGRDATAVAFGAVRRKLLLKNRGPADAPGLYLRAVQAYRRGDYEEALDLLSVVVRLDDQDARYWYYKALSERALGEAAAARESARRGAALELLGRADPTQTAEALERIQGDERQFLRAARGVWLTRERALRMASEPVPRPEPMGLASGPAGR
jgi:hypothetical protein